MEAKDIKPIPQYTERKIRALDKKQCPEQKGLRFYAYLTRIRKELVKITVAMRNKGKTQLLKQVTVHGVYSDKCLVRDLEYCYLGVYAYRVGWYDEGVKYRYGLRPWYNDGIWHAVDFKYYNTHAAVINPEYPLRFPEFKYSAIELYDPVCPVTYLRTYLQYPQTEYLVKLGLSKFVFSKMILRRADKDKQFCKWLIRNREDLQNNHYYADVILRAYRTGKPLAMLQAYSVAKKRLRSDSRLSPLRTLFKGETERFLAYIAAQNTNAHTYLDYLNACNYLGLDMSLPKNRYPHDFRRWHDIRIDEYATAKALQDEKERKALYARFAEIAEKYLPLQYGKNSSFVCVIARSPDDLIREGERLHHCVGRMNYDQRFIREESLIFFVREATKPDVPLVTVEYSLTQRRVLQCYGDKDSKPNDAVLHYVHKVWLPYANRTVKQLTADRAA